MLRRACFVYRWSTFGGIERVFLNRAEALSKWCGEWQIDVFFYSDAGGLSAFTGYLDGRELHHMRVVSEFDPDVYEYVFLFDTPQALGRCRHCLERVIVECHSYSPSSRAYLSRLPAGIKSVAFPSETFRDRIVAEHPELADKAGLLRNFVPWDLFEPHDVPALPDWGRRPVLYYGRMDELKNIEELLVACSELRRGGNDGYLYLFVGPVSNRLSLKDMVRSYGLRDRFVYLPPVRFDRSARFLASMRESGAIFVSPSVGESFGLSAAEAISAGIPVVLSDIPEHRWLVEHDAACLYRVGRPSELVERLVKCEQMYNAVSLRMRGYRDKFSASTFVQDWLAMTA